MMKAKNDTIKTKVAAPKKPIKSSKKVKEDKKSSEEIEDSSLLKKQFSRLDIKTIDLSENII